MLNFHYTRIFDSKIQIDNSLSSDCDISKKMNFHSRNVRSNNLTLQDCDKILQIQGMQQNIISDQLQYYPGNIKITIKDKPISRINQQNIQLLKQVFNTLLIHTVEKKRLRLLNKRIQENRDWKYLKRSFYQWRQAVNNIKLLSMKKRDEYKLEDLKRIELFIESVNNQRKKLEQEYKKKNIGNLSISNVKNDYINNSQQKFTNRNVENNHFSSPSLLFKNSLDTKRKIIAQQKMKLSEQNRIIEDMKLKQIQAESKLTEIETLNVINGTLINCKERSRKILMKLVKPRRENNNILKNSTKIVNTPQFLIRMEARAASRRQQIQRRKDERKIKLEQQQEIEQTIKINEEKRRKKIEKEARENANRIMAEREREKIMRLERIKIKNEIADKFYRKYLLNRYGIQSFIRLLQLKKKECNDIIMKRTFLLWKCETNRQISEKMTFYKNIYERKLLENIFKFWREKTVNEISKRQYVDKHYNFHLQKKCFNKWYAMTLSMRITNNENHQKAVNFYNKKMMDRHFKIWKKYLQVLDKIKDSDKRKNLLRQLVITVVPDFAPKIRGVYVDE